MRNSYIILSLFCFIYTRIISQEIVEFPKDCYIAHSEVKKVIGLKTPKISHVNLDFSTPNLVKIVIPSQDGSKDIKITITTKEIITADKITIFINDKKVESNETNKKDD